MAKSKKVRKKKKRVIPQPKPNIDIYKGVAFISYSIGCIALQKLTHELMDYWKGDKLPYVIFDQKVFPEVLKQPWKTIVLHRGGTHNWQGDKTKQFITMIRDKKKKDGTRFVYYIDDFLMHMNSNAPIHIMKECDSVIAKGYFLPEYLSKSEGIENVHGLKTWINLKTFDNPDYPPVPVKKPFNIVWFSAGRTGLNFIPEVFEMMEKDNSKMWEDTDWHCIGTGAALYRAKLNRFRSRLNLRKIP